MLHWQADMTLCGVQVDIYFKFTFQCKQDLNNTIFLVPPDRVINNKSSNCILHVHLTQHEYVCHYIMYNYVSNL